ncbi:hypothetical protein [Plantibacter flavus]|uniref:hypothetical protein n=1 Tax=Plantibacter flavus TaxID=150123 RepID=UPI0010C1AEF3|nr:hypothetical protein [Plantibacter flavus]
MELRDEWSAITGAATSSDTIKVNVSAEGARITKTWRVALLVQGDVLVGISLVRRVMRSGEFDLLIQIRQVAELAPPVAIDDLLIALPAGYADKWRTARNWNGILPPATGRRVGEGLESLRPGVAVKLRELIESLESGRDELSEAQVLVREQRDAVALGIELASIDSSDAIGRADPDDEVPFLRGLDGASAREDAHLRHDANLFASWMAAESEHVDVWRFQDPRASHRRVTILYADKGPLEILTGTDLIYYREETKAFVLVQYKRMRREGTSMYYRPDAQLEIEIERFEALGLQDSPAASVGEARLSSSPFYLKLVEPDIARPEGNRLSKGMYFPLELFNLVRASSAVIGPQGGVRIGYENAQRYITNGQFVDLVQESWIGTRGASSAALESLVHDALRGNRGLVVVADERDPGVVQRRP